MASGIYDNQKEHMWGSTGAAHTRPNFESGTIKVGIVNGTTDYAENLATDQDWSDTGYALDTCYNSEATQTLANKTVTAGVIDNTADITFTAVAIDGTKDVDAIVHYNSTGVVTTDALMLFHDGFTAVTPNGGDIVIQYNASGIAGI